MSKVAITPQSDLVSYDKDYFAWTKTNAELLRQQRFSEIDFTHVAEELEDMGKRERRALESQIRNVVLHLLKWKYQPEQRSISWRQSIRNGRIEIQKILRDSPSLAGQLPEMLVSEYPAARADATDETGLHEQTFPVDCPFAAGQLVDEGCWPT